MTDCSVSLTLQNRSPGRDISLYCLCSLFHISYLSLLLCIWCRDMHFLDNDQPINPHLSKRKWDNHHVAWYYWEGRLDLLKTGGILWLLLCSVNTERDRLKRLLNKKSHFKSLGKQVPFRSELCIRMQWKRRISINSCSFFKKKQQPKQCSLLHYINLFSLLVFSFPPTLSLAVPLEMSQWLGTIPQLRQVVTVALAPVGWEWFMLAEGWPLMVWALPRRVFYQQYWDFCLVFWGDRGRSWSLDLYPKLEAAPDGGVNAFQDCSESKVGYSGLGRQVGFWLKKIYGCFKINKLTRWTFVLPRSCAIKSGFCSPVCGLWKNGTNLPLLWQPVRQDCGFMQGIIQCISCFFSKETAQPL